MDNATKLQNTVDLLDKAMEELAKIKQQRSAITAKYQKKLKGVVTKLDAYVADKKEADFLKGDLSYKDFYHKLITFYKEKGVQHETK